jgi:uncharacterized protein YndB with AHSA1/START domain
MTTTMHRARVDLPSDREVRVVRQFAAQRELVWKAFTTPALLQRWLLGPPGWSMPVCEVDLRVGGAFRWRWRNDDDGKEFGFHGKFREIDPPARLVHTEVFDPGDVGGSMGDEALITATFDEADDVTTMTTVIRYASKADRDAALSTGMTDGMEMSYGLLDELLADG